MRRILVCVCLAIAVVGYAGLVYSQEADEGASQGKVVYEFNDADEMNEFGQMHLIKQAITTRIAVLQSYLAMETASLEQVDAQLAEKFDFSFEPGKNYQILRDEMVIREMGQVEQFQQ